MPCGAAIDALIGAAEGERTVLNQITLLWISPVAGAALWAEAEHGRASRIYCRWIRQLGGVKQFWRIRTLGHLFGRPEETIHIAVDIRRQTLAGLKNQNSFAGVA